MHLNIDRNHLQPGRRRFHRAFCGCAVVLGSLCAVIVSLSCAGIDAVSAAPPSITLIGQDAGKTFEVAVGQQVRVQLPSNPTTGYQWSVLGDPAPLKFVKSDYAADPQAAGRMGAGGTQTLRFTAKASGKVELKLGYARSWEKDVPPAKTFSVTIVVR